MESPGAPNTDSRRIWIYEQILRAEAHWTEQLQNQQQRIATILSANGIMLAFVSGSGLLAFRNSWWLPRGLLVASIAAFAAGLIFGLRALRPGVKVGNKTFLQPDWLISSLGSQLTDQVLADLKQSVKKAKYKKTLKKRRRLMTRQRGAIALGTVLLGAMVLTASV